MNEKDDILLEYLADTGCDQPPQVIHWNISQRGSTMSRKTVGRRLTRLQEIGLVAVVRQKGSYYRLTDDGEAYLAGDLDASELDPDEE